MNVFHARTWFAIAFAVLATVCVTAVVRDPNFMALPKPTSDGPVYENIAYHLSAGRGFWIDWQDPQWRAPYEGSAESADYGVYLRAPAQSMPATGRPPLLPAAIAAIYQMVERGPIAFALVRVFSALCLALGCALAVANAWTVTANIRVNGRPFSAWSVSLGCAAAIFLAASNRTLLSYASDFLTEPLALLLTQVLVVALLSLVREQADSASPQPLLRRRVAVISVALAGMILARSLFALWIPGMWVLLVVLLQTRHRIRDATLMVLLAMLCLSPWWIRNCLVLERFMPLGTQGPITMLGGYCDEALAGGGDWHPAPEQRLRQAMQDNRSFNALPSDAERELMIADESKRLVRAWIVAHWPELPRLFVARVITHWNPYFGKSLVWRLLILVGGVYLVAKRRPEAWVLVGLPVMNTVLVAALYTTGGRFLVPLYGILITLSAIGIAWIVEFSLARLASQPRPLN